MLFSYLSRQTNPDNTLYDLIQTMEYLDCVIKESLRLYPPAHAVNRECDESCTINGVYIPAGTRVLIPIYTLHRDPDAWTDAEKFIPERFESPNKEKIPPFQVDCITRITENTTRSETRTNE